MGREFPAPHESPQVDDAWMLREDRAWEVLSWFCWQGEGIPASLTVRFGGETLSLHIPSAVRKRSSQRVKLNPCHVCCNRRLIINSGTSKGMLYCAVLVESCAAPRVCSALCQEALKQNSLPCLRLSNHPDVGFGCIPHLAGRRFCIFMAFLWMDVGCLCGQQPVLGPSHLCGVFHVSVSLASPILSPKLVFQWALRTSECIPRRTSGDICSFTPFRDCNPLV